MKNSSAKIIVQGCQPLTISKINQRLITKVKYKSNCLEKIDLLFKNINNGLDKSRRK